MTIQYLPHEFHAYTYLNADAPSDLLGRWPGTGTGTGMDGRGGGRFISLSEWNINQIKLNCGPMIPDADHNQALKGNPILMTWLDRGLERLAFAV